MVQFSLATLLTVLTGQLIQPRLLCEIVIEEDPDARISGAFLFQKFFCSARGKKISLDEKVGMVGWRLSIITDLPLSYGWMHQQSSKMAEQVLFSIFTNKSTETSNEQ